MVPSTCSLVVTIALALTAHAHSFFHQHCVDYDSLDESNSREVSFNVISDDCGVPVVDAVFNQYCFKHFSIVPEVVPTQQVVPGIYKFRAPHYQHHFITAEKAGYHATMASIEYGNSKVTKTLKMLCNSPPMWDMFHTGYTASQCTTNTAQLMVNYVCEATGSPAPEIYPRGSVTMETVSPDVVTFDTCPSCSGTVVIIVDGVTHEIPVPTEDQVLDLACPVDGGWTNFGVWGDCSVTCGTGVQTHTRTCTDPAPLNDGAECEGEPTEEQECTMPECIVPINGGWSFSAWTECSTTCNEGKQQRSRTCNNPEPDNGGADCEGDPTESRTCNLGKCPIW